MFLVLLFAVLLAMYRRYWVVSLGIVVVAGVISLLMSRSLSRRIRGARRRRTRRSGSCVP
jgi:hypothetical protein